MNALDPATIRKARSAAAMLASNQAGERHAAMTALDRLLPGALAGLVIKALDDVVLPSAAIPADPYGRRPRKARTILGSGMPLSRWEREFLEVMAAGRRPATVRQAQALDRICSAFFQWVARHG